LGKKTEDKKLLKCLSYISYLQKGNKPRFPAEAIRHLANLLQSIEKLSASDGRFKVTIGITTPNGNIDVNLLEDCGYVFHHLFPVLFTAPSNNTIDQYFKVTTSFLSSSNISNTLKAQIIDFENQSFKDVLEQGFVYSPHGFEALESRLKFCRVGLAKPNDDAFGELNAIKNIFSTYVSKALKYFVNNGQFLQGSSFLYTLLESSDSTNEKTCIVRFIISHNTSFNLSSKTELSSLLDEYEDEYSSEDVDFMRSEIDSDPSSMHVSFFSFGNGNLSLKSTRNRDVATVISFSIPNACTDIETRQIEAGDKTTIILSPVAAFWADPMFKVMSDWKIANMGWSHFCDVEPKEGRGYTHVQVVINELFSPDVELLEDSNKLIDFSEKEALMGRPFYPHKDFVVRVMLDNFVDISECLDIEKGDININLFSNYFVQHIDSSTGESIHHKLFAITNPDSYSKTTTKFIERLNSINLSDSLVDVRDLLTSTKIETEKNLTEFVKRSIDLFVKHNIENHGGYKYLWKTDSTGELKPCREPESQPYIFSHLRAIFDFMGIQISREVESSNGEIDFLLSYNNSQNKLLRLCVELKLAHASKIEDGLTKQLPAYMKGERCKYGIYVALWYKCTIFEKPEGYSSIRELKDRLEKINSNNRVVSIIIDCSKPTSPSKLK
jgi:hypothetical protein